MRTIHKFPLTPEDLDEGGVVTLPVGDVVLVAAQHPSDTLPTIWIDRDTTDTFHQHLTVAGTGQHLYGDLAHIGSAVCAGGSLVWHVYGPTS